MPITIGGIFSKSAEYAKISFNSNVTYCLKLRILRKIMYIKRCLPRMEANIGQNSLLDDFAIGKPSKLKSKWIEVLYSIPANACFKHFLSPQYHILPFDRISTGTLVGVRIRVRLSHGKKIIQQIAK